MIEGISRRSPTRFTLCDSHFIGVENWPNRIPFPTKSSRVPSVFRKRGFKITLQLDLHHSESIKPDIFDAFTNLKAESPFELHRGYEKVEGVTNLGQVLQIFKDNSLKEFFLKIETDPGWTVEHGQITLYGQSKTVGSPQFTATYFGPESEYFGKGF